MSRQFSRVIGVLIILIVCSAAPRTAVMSQSKPRNVNLTPPKWSADASKLAIPLDNMVEIRDALTKQLVSSLHGHTDFITSVAWSPDGNTIATSSIDQTVKLWRASDGQLIRTLSGHNDYVTFVAWTPDGKYVVSSGFDVKPNFFIWNAATGEVIARYMAGTVRDGSFSPDGRKFVYVIGSSLQLRDSTTYAVIASYRGASSSFNIMDSVVWSPDGTQLVTGSGDGLVTVWDASNAAIEKQFRLTDYTNSYGKPGFDVALAVVRDVRFGENGTTVVGVAGDGTLKEWNVQTGAVVQQTKLAPLATASFSPYGARLAVLDASFLPALDGTPSQMHSADIGFQVIVPNPTLERLNALAAVCVKHGNASNPAVQALTAKAVTQATLSTFERQVKTLPNDAIPIACQADLLTVAEALQK